jgi:hypothetical protein
VKLPAAVMKAQMPCIGATAAWRHKAVRMNWCKQYNHFIHGHRMTEILIYRTGQPEVIAASDGRLTVTVPIRIKRRGLRKVVTLPDGGRVQRRSWDDTPTPLQLALARGHRWLALLESGEAKSLKEIAKREAVDDSYVSRMQPDHARARYRYRHPRGDIAGGGDAVGPGGGNAVVVGRAVGEG